MAIETDITKLVFNKLSNEKYEELKANGELVNNEFYITPDSKEDFDGTVPTKVSELENDLGFITADDVDLSTKADKETTYTKEEVDNLIQNVDIPEQTPNIKGGEYIDVIEPKGETLYEIGKSDNFVNFGELNFGWIQYYVNTTDGDYVTIDYNNTVTQPSEIITYRLPTEYEEKLIPIYDADKNPIIANNIITDELYSIIAPQMGFEVETLTDEQKEEIKSVIIPNVDFQEPLYAIKCYKDESGLAPILTEDFIGVFVKTKTGEYGLITHLFGNITPINTIELESESNALIVDFNEKALEMIENAGSDITTNGWNIFDHKFSDHLLNDPSWVRSDTFSWQDGGIYFTAYEELEKENSGRIEDTVLTETWYAYVQNDGSKTLYTNEEIPVTEENTTISVPLYEVSGDETSGYSFTQSSIYTIQFKYSDESVRVGVEAEPGLIINEYFKYTEESNIVIEGETIKGNLSSDTYDDITITYYKSTNGLKICLPDQSDAIEQLYAITGVAWYYIIDTENKRFKLPRSKWNFVGSRGNVGDYVDESLPNITGNVKNVRWQDTTDEMEGAFSDSTKDSINLQNYYQGTKNSDAGLLDFNASNSSSTYQDDAPVQQRATEMYLYFFMGDTLRDARIIDVNAVIEDVNTINETLNNKANIDLSNIPFLLPKMTLIYEGNIAKDNYVTFTQDPDDFDIIIANKSNMFLYGKSFSSRIKLNGLWCGVDTETQLGYSQTYAMDFGDKDGTTYKVWFYAWTPTETISYTQMNGNYKIYGIKFFGGI